MVLIQILLSFCSVPTSLQVDTDPLDAVSLLQTQTAVVGKQGENAQSLENRAADARAVSQYSSLLTAQIPQTPVQSNDTSTLSPTAVVLDHTVGYNVSALSMYHPTARAKLESLGAISAVLENHSEDVGLVHLSVSAAHNSSAMSQDYPKAEAKLNNHGTKVSLAATFKSHSEIAFVHNETLSVSEADSASALSLRHPIADETHEKHGTNGNLEATLEDHRDLLGLVHLSMSAPNNSLALSLHRPLADATLDDHGANVPLAAKLENHSEDLALAHDGPISVSEADHPFALSLRHPMAEAKHENHGTFGHLEATLKNHSKDLEFVHQGRLSASEVHNDSALSIRDSLVDVRVEEHAAAKLENHSEDLGFVHVVAPKPLPSKKQSRTGALEKNAHEDSSDMEEAKLLEIWVGEMQQNRALDFHEHRPSAVEVVAAHQSGLLYNAWLVSRAGFGVVVGLAVALMWLLQCSRLCTRSVATPKREEFDQRVLADVYKSAQCSKLCARMAATSTQIPRENYDQHVLADVYKAAQARSRLHTPGLVETVADSSRLLRWVSGKRSKKTDDTHGDEAADYFEAKHVAKRWYDR